MSEQTAVVETAADSTSTGQAQSAGQQGGNAQFQAGQQSGQVGQQAAQDDEFTRVPKSSLKRYNGDWTQVAKRATQYDLVEQSGLLELGQVLSEQGYSTQQVTEYFKSLGMTNAQANQAAGQVEQQNGSAADKPLTREELNALLDEREQKAQAKRAEQEAAQRQEETYRRETGDMVAALKELGLEPSQDEALQEEFEDAMALMDRQLAKIKRSGFQPHPALPDALNNKKLAEYMARPATAAQIKAAQDKLRARFADAQNRAVGNFAQRQTQTMPNNSTLAGGIGGRQQAKKASEMTKEERIAYVTQDIPETRRR